MVNVISMNVSASILPRVSATITAAIQPTRTPPRNTLKKVAMPVSMTAPLKLPASRISTSNMAITREVASLKRLSPSTNTVSLSGTPNCLNMAITATGSVALNMAPNRSATRMSLKMSLNWLATSHMMSPMIAVETINPGTARVRMGRMFRLT